MNPLWERTHTRTLLWVRAAGSKHSLLSRSKTTSRATAEMQSGPRLAQPLEGALHNGGGLLVRRVAIRKKGC